MRTSLVLALGFLAALAALVAWSDEAEASTACHASGNWCQGYSHASTATGGVSGARCFALRTSNTAPACSATTGITPINEATWQADPGGCVTMYYFDVATGASPPPVPNKVTIQVRFDNTATSVIFFLNAAAEPANGSSYSFCTTSTGVAGASVRAGTYAMHLVAQKDNGAGGVGNYLLRSDGTGGASTVFLSFDSGALRGKMQASSITRNAYPAGSMFAYGPAGDESITITGTFTQPNGDANIETMRTFILDAATLTTYGAAGSSVDVDATTLAQSYVVDSTFPAAGSPYNRGLSIVGNAGLTNQKWSAFSAAGHGSGVAVLSDTTVYDTTAIDVDPGIKLDSDGSGGYGAADGTDKSYVGTCTASLTELFNRGEGICHSWYIYNARSELLSRSMTFSLEDAAMATCISYGSLAPSSNLYSITTTLTTGGSCLAAADTTGSSRHLMVTNTDQAYDSATTFFVSSLYFVDAHTQISGTLVQDDYPTENANEDFSYLVQGDGMGGDASETIHLWCHVVNVRKDQDIDTSGSAVSWSIKDPATATRASGTTDTAADGWTPASLNYLASTPLGTWTGNCSATLNGNTGLYNQDVAVDVAGGATANLMGDPLKIYGGDAAYAGEVVRLAISESFLDGTARTGNAAGTFIRILTPSNTLEVTDATPTEVSHGVYRYDWTPATTGPYLVLARTTDPDSGDPVGTSNIVYVRDPAMAAGNYSGNLSAILGELGTHDDNLQEHRDSTIEVLMTSNFAGYGFDGLLFVVLWLVAFLVFLRNKKLLSALFASAGLVAALFKLGAFQVLPMALLAVALWLEAIGKDGIIIDYFRGDKPAGRREPET